MACELSIIIPTLNEVDALPGLLADLAAQAGVTFEVLVSDGGSIDGTREIAAALLDRYRLTGDVLTGPAGRGMQLNRGAARARGTWLLFLHADSRILEPVTLAESLAELRRKGNPYLAGHFTLRFDLPDAERDFDYYLCEVKARSGLPGTIHGDQGFWLPAAFFRELEGFREDLPVMEDTLLAEEVRSKGTWQRLPAIILTSPRRFLVEGYAERQTLNALLMNFATIGWDEPLHRVPDAYRRQDRTDRLQLAPLFRMIDAMLRELPWRKRLRVWTRTGAFVRDNAWQLVLQRTTRRAFAAGACPETVSCRPVEVFRHRFDRVTDHPAGHLVAALLTWLWFRTRSRKSAQGA